MQIENWLVRRQALAAGDLRGDWIWGGVVDVDVPQSRRAEFPAASVAETVKEWRPSEKSPIRESSLAHLVRAGPRLREVARKRLRLCPRANRRCDVADPGLSRAATTRLRLRNSPAHPLPARQRATQRNRRRDRVVHRHLQNVSVHRCSGMTLGSAAEDQLLHAGRALRRGERHGPAAVVESRRVAVLAVRQSHDRRSAGHRSEEGCPTAAVPCHPPRPAHVGDRRSRRCREGVAGVVVAAVSRADQAITDARGRAASGWAGCIRIPGVAERCPRGAAVSEQRCGVAREDRVRTRRGNAWRAQNEEAARCHHQHAHARLPSWVR